MAASALRSRVVGSAPSFGSTIVLGAARWSAARCAAGSSSAAARWSAGAVTVPARSFAKKGKPNSNFGESRRRDDKEQTKGVPGEGPQMAASRKGLEQFFDLEPGKLRHGKPVYTGRSWSASELRVKSFDDLHTLWYVLLKERNMLLSERSLAKAHLNEHPSDESLRHYFVNVAKRNISVKRSMARIKLVLRERDLFEQFKNANPNWEEDIGEMNFQLEKNAKLQKDAWKQGHPEFADQYKALQKSQRKKTSESGVVLDDIEEIEVLEEVRH